MRTTVWIACAVAAAAGIAAAKDPVKKAEIGWLKTLEEGKKASAKAGKPILLVTLWPPAT